MDNIMETKATVEEKLGFDQEVFNGIMDRFCAFVYGLYEQGYSATAIREVLKKEPLEVTNYVLETCDTELEDDDDRSDMVIVFDEAVVYLVELLNRLSEKNRNKFRETFLENKD